MWIGRADTICEFEGGHAIQFAQMIAGGHRQPRFDLCADDSIHRRPSRRMRLQHYATIVPNAANDAFRPRSILRGMIERQVDGLVIATATPGDPIPEEWLEDRVLIARDFDKLSQSDHGRITTRSREPSHVALNASFAFSSVNTALSCTGNGLNFPLSKPGRS
jgi:hypothetical protein